MKLRTGRYEGACVKSGVAAYLSVLFNEDNLRPLFLCPRSCRYTAASGSDDDNIAFERFVSLGCFGNLFSIIARLSACLFDRILYGRFNSIRSDRSAAYGIDVCRIVFYDRFGNFCDSVFAYALSFRVLRYGYRRDGAFFKAYFDGERAVVGDCGTGIRTVLRHALVPAAGR